MSHIFLRAMGVGSSAMHCCRVLCLILPLYACTSTACSGSSRSGSSGSGSSTGSTPVASPRPTSASDCGDGVCSAGEFYLNCSHDCPYRVGTFYSGWHWPAYTAVSRLQAMNLPVMTVEQLLESRSEDGSATGNGNQFDELLLNYNMTNLASGFYYQHMPAGGPYCIVHQRQPGDINYNPSHEGFTGNANAPDCPDYAATVTRQAAQMVAAGIDYLVVDGTNISDYSAGGDGIQLRPFEVLVQQFTALRASGVPTPEVAMWQRFPSDPVVAGDTNDFMYRHVLNVYNDAAYQNVIMHDDKSGNMVYFYPDIGGFDPNFPSVINENGGAENVTAVPMWAYAQSPNQWSFMSACEAGAHINNSDCNQAWTPTSVLGSQMAVVPTYQQGWGSMPWQAAGLLGGLTLRKQFATAIATHPDYLLLSSWNETIAQPGANGPSMGLETDPTAVNVAFVDNYGTEFCRDIEPSEELGSFVYDLVTSCLRIYRSGADTCNDPDEPCCQGGNFYDNYVEFNGSGGIFVLYANASAGRTALYNCNAYGDSFFSLQADCEGQTMLGLVGYMADKRGGPMLRSLFRCVEPNSYVHTYSLTAACPSGTQVEAVLGYVR